MAPVKRGKRKSGGPAVKKKAAKKTAKSESRVSDAESIHTNAAGEVSTLEFGTAGPSQDVGQDGDVHIPDSIFATPQAVGAFNRVVDFPSGSIDPTAANGIVPNVVNSHARTESLIILPFTINQGGQRAAISSNLEDARDIQYGVVENVEDDGEGEEEFNMDILNEELRLEKGKGHPTTGGLSLRRSSRLSKQESEIREPSPSTALTAILSKTHRIVKKPRKTRKSAPKTITTVLRRSARLAKPLESFHKYTELPNELKIMVWEAAITPRLTYICNRGSVLNHALTFGIQNKLPNWFMVCKLSVYVAKMHYQKLFALAPALPFGDVVRPGQDINPAVDIVVFEPCHSGCRGFYCAQSYSQHDRSAVKQLVVQIDSANLVPGSEPGWVTISRSWPNVETLYMMKTAVTGVDQRDKAMIRIKGDLHEKSLRRGFNAWKKAAGKDLAMSKLEFVRVVQRESGALKDRYASVTDRLTGYPEDIIHG
ncbi:hypothetical protein F5Y16DRAFT_215033 [Xylariaceae sp. FL0255]|nr:hypothetical protein F5Y16DRAFT_215033 [Xylariaceae sp. FL0255]